MKSGSFSPLIALFATYADTISAVNEVRSSSLLSIFLAPDLYRGHRTKIRKNTPNLAGTLALYFKTVMALYHYDFRLRKGKRPLSTAFYRATNFRRPASLLKINRQFKCIEGRFLSSSSGDWRPAHQGIDIR